MPTLTHTTLTAPGKAPTKWLLFLHGILGTGANWRGIARQIVMQRPNWGAVLVDLRMHGGSQDFSPPHTIAAAADDLEALPPLLPGPVAGVVGHSFGGKVALTYAARRATNLDVLWTLDSNPGPRQDARGSEQTLRVMDALQQLEPTFATREAFRDEMLGRGFSTAIVAWLAMNVRETNGAYALRLNLTAIRAMLEDYLALDLWPLIEAPPEPSKMIHHVVIADASNVFRDEDRIRIARAAEARPNAVRAHTLEGAGHWVHVDAPEPLLALIVDSMSA